MFSWMKPSEDKFFDLFSQSTRIVKKAALALREAMMDQSEMEDKLELISKIEEEADDINDAIIDTLNQTFITPLDREDIYQLANKLDDIADFVQGTMERMVLYRIEQPSGGAVEISRLLVDCTEELVKAFDLLKNIRGNQHKILDHTRKIVVLENEGDRIYRKEVARLFVSCPDPIEVIKWKEVLEHLEEALDQCEYIADLLRGVVMKYA